MTRHFLAVFILSILITGPMLALAGNAKRHQSTGAQSMQKGMCFAAGVGCGTGPIILPTLSRLR